MRLVPSTMLLQGVLNVNSGDTLANYRSFWGLASAFLKFGHSFAQVMTKSRPRQVVCRFAHVFLLLFLQAWLLPD